MAWNLNDKVYGYLKDNPGQRFTAREIADWIFENHPKDCEQKRERSRKRSGKEYSDKDFITQIASEITAHQIELFEKYSTIKIIDERPREFYYSEKTDEEEVIEAEAEADKHRAIASDEKGTKLSEHDLYPLLGEYLASEFGLYSKRIDEKRSRNRQGAKGNHWLYPDVVAFENLSANWHKEVKKSASLYGDTKTNLWSFEVKKLINRSNVRESFFQAVSNSSWANLGYLVASEIHNNALPELLILSRLHGIGFIKLDINNPAESQIRISAQERPDVDWHTANRLVEENGDFHDYIRRTRLFYTENDFDSNDWISSPEQFEDE